MAENENGQERTEQPSAKRLREAREKGQVARSREFNTFVVLLTGAGFILAFGGYLGGRLGAQMAAALTLERARLFEPALLLSYLQDQLAQALLTLAPLFAVLFVAALLGPILVGGANFSSHSFMPNFGKLNPISGFKRLFSAQGLVELGKTLIKFLVVGVVAGMLLWGMLDQLLALAEQPLEHGIIQTGYLAARTLLLVSAALALIAVIDVPWQLWTYQKRLRMTRQELKDEYKETDGKPEVKGRIRQMQQEMARRRMMAEVPKADVVITNPTHYAVAIAYQAESMAAPRLLAKGADAVAVSIRTIAEEHRILCLEAPRVARAIYFTTEIDQEIPAGLFVAVARILAYVYQLRRQDPDVRMPSELPVPEEYLDPLTARQVRRQSR